MTVVESFHLKCSETVFLAVGFYRIKIFFTYLISSKFNNLCVKLKKVKITKNIQTSQGPTFGSETENFVSGTQNTPFLSPN
jgi:hypothetical protein